MHTCCILRELHCTDSSQARTVWRCALPVDPQTTSPAKADHPRPRWALSCWVRNVQTFCSRSRSVLGTKWDRSHSPNRWRSFATPLEFCWLLAPLFELRSQVEHIIKLYRQLLNSTCGSAGKKRHQYGCASEHLSPAPKTPIFVAMFTLGPCCACCRRQDGRQ